MAYYILCKRVVIQNNGQGKIESAIINEERKLPGINSKKEAIKEYNRIMKNSHNYFGGFGSRVKERRFYMLFRKNKKGKLIPVSL